MIWLIYLLLLLAAASLFYIFYLPGKLFLGPEKTRAGYLRERKDAVYENLRDFNFEYKAGKVPDSDYTSLKSSLQDEAATILAEIARLENPAPQKGPPRNISKDVPRTYQAHCHPERSGNFAKRSFHAVEGPLFPDSTTANVILPTFSSPTRIGVPAPQAA